MRSLWMTHKRVCCYSGWGRRAAAGRPSSFVMGKGVVRTQTEAWLVRFSLFWRDWGAVRERHMRPCQSLFDPVQVRFGD